MVKAIFWCNSWVGTLGRRGCTTPVGLPGILVPGEFGSSCTIMSDMAVCRMSSLGGWIRTGFVWEASSSEEEKSSSKSSDSSSLTSFFVIWTVRSARNSSSSTSSSSSKTLYSGSASSSSIFSIEWCEGGHTNSCNATNMKRCIDKYNNSTYL